MPLAPMLSFLLVIGASSASGPIQGQKVRTAQDDYAAAGKLAQESIAGALNNYESGDQLRAAIEQERRRAQEQSKLDETSQPNLDDVTRLGKALRALPSGPGRPTRLDFDRVIAQEFEPAWRLILQGNRNPNMPEPQKELDLHMDFPINATFRLLAKICVRKARSELAIGNGAAALRTFRETFQFTQRIRNQSDVDRLVMVAMEAIIFAELERSMAALPSQGLPELIQTISASVTGPSKLQSSLVGERINSFAFVEMTEKEFETDPKAAAAYDSYPDDDEEEDEDEPKWRALFESLSKSSPAERRIFFQNVRARLDQTYGAFGRMLAQPEFNWNFKPESAPTTSNVDFYVSVHTSLLPDMARADAQARTRCRIAAITLAAREFTWQHGRYPTDLSEFLTKAEAHDPLNNKPFEYSIEQGNIVVKTAVHPILGQITLRKLPADAAAARRPKRP
ncbi:hypothetical protein MCEMSE15_00841 [Fimbriimonadaceae bacterium]